MKHNFGRQGVEVWGAQIDEEKKTELSLQSVGGHDNILMKSLPNKVNRYSTPVPVLTKPFFLQADGDQSTVSTLESKGCKLLLFQTLSNDFSPSLKPVLRPICPSPITELQ